MEVPVGKNPVFFLRVLHLFRRSVGDGDEDYLQNICKSGQYGLVFTESHFNMLVLSWSLSVAPLCLPLYVCALTALCTCATNNLDVSVGRKVLFPEEPFLSGHRETVCS